MYGIRGLTAVYLIRGARTCLVDAGLRSTAPRLLEALARLGAFPPDLIIVTHPHSDHALGIPSLREEASRMGRSIEVLAAAAAIPLLAEGSFGDLSSSARQESIQEVTPVGEGDTIDLGGVTLRIYEVPGHCQGHVAVLDEKSGTIFVGDAVGYRPADDVFVPGFVPSSWDPDAFVSSLEKLRRLPYEAMCLAHFGRISGAEARSILDEAVDVYQRWWQFFERHAERLEDTDYLLEAMRKEIRPGIPALKPVSLASRFLLSLTLAGAAVVGRKTTIIDKLAYGDLVTDLARGYRMYTQQ
jgi:glyoxylase-like metal-dependent hydrolase (beta-lactamase superfamily II)